MCEDAEGCFNTLNLIRLRSVDFDLLKLWSGIDDNRKHDVSRKKNG